MAFSWLVNGGYQLLTKWHDLLSFNTLWSWELSSSQCHHLIKASKKPLRLSPKCFLNVGLSRGAIDSHKVKRLKNLTTAAFSQFSGLNCACPSFYVQENLRKRRSFPSTSLGTVRLVCLGISMEMFVNRNHPLNESKRYLPWFRRCFIGTKHQGILDSRNQ